MVGRPSLLLLCCSVLISALGAAVAFPRPAPSPVDATTVNATTDATITADSYSFLVIGDYGFEGTSVQYANAGAMDDYAGRFGSDFVLSVGDNIYQNGVTSVDDPKWNTQWYNIFKKDRKNLQSKLWTGVLGNHDYCYTQSPSVEIEYTGRNGWKMPARHYIHKVTTPQGATLAFVNIDTNYFAYGEALKRGDSSVSWIVRDCSGMPQTLRNLSVSAEISAVSSLLSQAASQADFVFVSGHHPIGGAYCGAEGNLGDLAKLVHDSRNRVTAYFYGHVHTLEYGYTSGVLHVQSGAGGNTGTSCKGNAGGGVWQHAGTGGFALARVFANHVAQHVAYISAFCDLVNLTTNRLPSGRFGPARCRGRNEVGIGIELESNHLLLFGTQKFDFAEGLQAPHSSSRTINKPKMSSWTCPQCTLINEPLVLQCEACLLVRPSTASANPPVSPILVFDDEAHVQDDETDINDHQDAEDAEDAELMKAIKLSLLSTTNSSSASEPKSEGLCENSRGKVRSRDEFEREAADKSSGSSKYGASDLVGKDDPSADSSASSFLSQRALLEKERLARLAKSHNSSVPSAASSSSSSSAGASFSREPPQKRARMGNIVTLDTISTPSGAGSESAYNGHSGSEIAPKYLDGKVGLTYVKGFSRVDCIAIQDLIKKKHLQKAVLSAFQIDRRWLASILPSDIKLCVVGDRPKDMPETMHHTQISENELWVFPPKLPGYGCMHTKLMLLWYDGFLRVVVASANLVDYDWEELENASFDNVRDRFGRELLGVLSALHVPNSVKNLLSQYDYGRATAFLVASVAGQHSGENLYTFGHLGLSRTIRNIITTYAGAHAVSPNVTGTSASRGAGRLAGGTTAMDAASLARMTRTNKAASIDYQTSSLGSLTYEWHKDFYNSLCGDDRVSQDYYSKEEPPPKRKKSTADKKKKTVEGEMLETDELPPLRVLFPTRRTVLNSNLGESGAGTITFGRQYWVKEKFPRPVMRDCISKRDGSLMHTKVIKCVWDDSMTPPSNGSSSGSTSAATATEGRLRGCIVLIIAIQCKREICEEWSGPSTF
ncbi:hypothetical protein HK102_003259 [Quaeritorhiza haematococci]|nr:hypothetical protein HK102_003259 [Quaeritorhiza haematococci]